MIFWKILNENGNEIICKCAGCIVFELLQKKAQNFENEKKI